MHLVVQAPEIATGNVKALAQSTGGRSIVALKRSACDAFRIEHIVTSEGTAAFCAAAALDFALVPNDRVLDRVRLIAMDMDSTLITIECIDELADMLGIKDRVAAITARAMRGEIDFATSVGERLALLRGARVGALERVYAERLELSPGAERLLAAAKRIGAATLLVSGGFTFFTERLQSRLGFDHVLANTLEIDGGVLTGRVIGDIVDAAAKARIVRRLRDELATGDALAVAIGDGANDLPMLAEAHVSVAYRAKPAVRARTTHAIDHCGLDAVLNLFV